MTEWKKIDTASQFISWGKLGQQVELEVVAYDPAGGVNFKGDACPRVLGVLTADCDNYRNLRSGGEHVRLTAGTQVTVDGAVTNLHRALTIASPARGDKMRFTFADTYQTESGNPGKVIEVEISRVGHNPAPANDLTAEFSDEPF